VCASRKYVLCIPSKCTVHHLLLTSTQHQARVVAQRRPPAAGSYDRTPLKESPGRDCGNCLPLQRAPAYVTGFLSWIIHLLCVFNGTPFYGGRTATVMVEGGGWPCPVLIRPQYAPVGLWLGAEEGFCTFLTPFPWAALTHRFFVAGKGPAVGHGAIPSLIC
jgi:hypothetical protein